jgi:hypothetical protein
MGAPKPPSKAIFPIAPFDNDKRPSQSLAGDGKILGYGEQPGAALRLVWSDVSFVERLREG